MEQEQPLNRNATKQEHLTRRAARSSQVLKWWCRSICACDMYRASHCGFLWILLRETCALNYTQNNFQPCPYLQSVAYSQDS